MAFSSPSKVSSPSRLSLLTSDIDEDLGILDLRNDKRYDFVTRDQLWLLRDDEYFTEVHQLPKILEWINSFSTVQDDSYFSVTNKITPVNGYNRFEYLTKSVSRTATITRRRIDSASDDSLGTPPVSNSRFGTITKGTIHPNETHSNGSPVNTNTITKNRGSYVVKRMLPLLNGIHPMSNEESTPSSDLESSNTNRTYVILEPHDQHDLSSDSSTDLLGNETHSNGFPVNTNTITKNRRSYLVKRLLPVPNGIHPMSNEESAPSSDFEISNNDDLNIDLNRNYEPYPTDSDDTVSSGRNYPTITRNNTRTLLVRRETSQGSLKSRLASQSKKNCLASSSNEDLLSDNSALSIHSNLSMTSSMSGRSEPNLIGVQNLAIYNKSVSNAQTNKYQSRLAGPSNKPQVVSRTKPLLQGGLNKRVPNSRLPNSSVNSFGSMGSLQSNMTRGVSKTMLETSEDDCVLLDRNSHKMLSALDRKSTFRVHRPSGVASVTSLFSTDHRAGSDRTSASRSNENVLCSSQEEINLFRNKVLQSNGCRIPSRPGSNQSHYPMGVSHTRSESPSSNSSTTSSSSLSGPSRISVTMNWPNNNHRSSESLITCNSLPASTNHLNNNNPSETNLYSNNGLTMTITNHPSDKANSRIPALPKSLSALPRLNTQAYGIQRHPINDQSGTMDRKLKTKSALPISKLTSNEQVNMLNNNHQALPNTFRRATLLESPHQWQNNCY